MILFLSSYTFCILDYWQATGTVSLTSLGWFKPHPCKCGRKVKMEEIINLCELFNWERFWDVISKMLSIPPILGNCDFGFLFTFPKSCLYGLVSFISLTGQVFQNTYFFLIFRNSIWLPLIAFKSLTCSNTWRIKINHPHFQQGELELRSFWSIGKGASSNRRESGFLGFHRAVRTLMHFVSIFSNLSSVNPLLSIDA